MGEAPLPGNACSNPWDSCQDQQAVRVSCVRSGCCAIRPEPLLESSGNIKSSTSSEESLIIVGYLYQLVLGAKSFNLLLTV